jgi:hypothetical protein
MSNSNGLEELAAELERMAIQITDPLVKRRVLEAGAKPIVNRARQTMKRYRSTGTLDKGIISAYNERTERQEIGHNNRAFYGFFYDLGYRPITGNRKRVGNQWRWKNKRPSGRTIQRAHTRPSFAAERENVAQRMIETYRNEIGG